MSKKPKYVVYDSGADISPCERYRYALWRRWEADKPLVAFIGLNPSVADASLDDPTIRRCINFAGDWGYGGLMMLNAYAFRATLPKVMLAAEDPIGPFNDVLLAMYLGLADLVVAAWGTNCDPARAEAVCKLADRPISCLVKTKYGSPMHPLYVPRDKTPEPFWPKAQS